DPVPGPGEVRIGIRAAGINFPDVLVIAGTYQVKVPPPFIPGNEAAGIVEAVGEGVGLLQPGDRVIATPTGGAFAEKCVLAEKLCLPLPAALSFEQGAGFTVTYATTYHAFRQCTELKAGETVLVLGAAGGVGSSAVEVAKALGAKVIAAASSEEKLQFAREAGADETINYSDVSLRDAVKELTGGNGVDVVYDPVGGELAQMALRSLAWHGRYLVIGFACGRIPEFPANIALLKEASIIGVWWGTWAARNPRESLQNMAELAAMVDDRSLVPRVTERYGLERYADAFAAITERRARGKVVLTMAG
ncbi:MAG TPA: NADPH:quinone oxidoreductase family protein, partial [Xanthomonadales bacterium]|nr:NADPH:quinone oxidoreductase family protein [Xanthomonadales bacterium]